jgi:serine/threonine protein kinase
MESRDWSRVQKIYDAALPLSPAERSAFIASACGNDHVLKNEVNELLGADDSSSGFLETPFFKMGLEIISVSDEIDDLIGETIDDRYYVVKRLGKGGMGKVFFARDLQLLEKPVVIKVLLNSGFEDPEALRRFKQEVQALTLVQHPNIVDVTDAGELPDGQPYVVMEYIDGVTLRSQIPSGGMDLNRAATILKQIGAALSHIHDKGILHRDLKPENIMLRVLSDGTELVKIVDFGIAKVKDSALTGTVQNVPIGTRPYMSPEQLNGEALTPASDVYAMAVIAYEIVSGERPLNQTSAPSRRGLSRNAQALMVRGLSSKPADRPQRAKTFGDELASFFKVGIPIRRFITIAIILACFSLLSFAIYRTVIKPPPPPIPSKGFNYWLMIQQTRDGKDYQDPYTSNGDETFAAGDRFQLNVQSLESGYLYVFNEGTPESGKIGFRLIYPTQQRNGEATLGANQTVQLDWITLSGPAGAENVWIVWSVSPVNELESAKSQALTHPQAGLIDRDVMAVKDFLMKMQSQIEVRVTKYKTRQQLVTVRAKNDLVPTLAQFKHR